MILNSILVVVLLGGFLCCTNVQGLPWMQFLPFIFASHIQFEGYGSVDTRGGAGVGIRVAFRLKRHAMSLPEDRFHLRIEASPCQFLVYDRNEDGRITREEVHDVFPDRNLAEKLFRDLDSTTGDNIITPEEFFFMAPKLIYGCDTRVPDREPEHVLRQSQQTEDSATAEASDEKIDETSEDLTEE